MKIHKQVWTAPFIEKFLWKAFILKPCMKEKTRLPQELHGLSGFAQNPSRPKLGMISFILGCEYEGLSEARKPPTWEHQRVRAQYSHSNLSFCKCTRMIWTVKSARERASSTASLRASQVSFPILLSNPRNICKFRADAGRRAIGDGSRLVWE